MTLRSHFAVLCLLACAGAVVAQTLSTDSPFVPSGGAVTAPGAPSAYELVGIIATSSQTLVGITQVANKRSLWIPVGKSSEGIEVVSCDPKQDSAVIRVGGETKSLTLKSATVASGPLPGAAAVASLPALATPGTQAEQEREARMLVSDLMEIGMQQRKAYEEAQRKAAAQQKAAAKK